MIYNELPSIISMNAFLLFIFLSLFSYSSAPDENAVYYVLNPQGAELFEKPELRSRPLLTLHVGGKVVAEEILKTNQSKKALEGFFLEGSFIKVTLGDKTGYMFTSDLTQIHLQVRKLREGFWVADILGNKIRTYEKKRMENFGDRQFEIIDQITEYENGIHTYTAFDGCFNEKYSFQLSLSEVFFQMIIGQVVINETDNRIVSPEFIEKKENVYYFQGAGATEDLKIIDNGDGTLTLSFYSCT